jgi:hypothetical protein
MVFQVGDLITGWGRVVVDDEGHWLDLGRVTGLGYNGLRRPRSAKAVRLFGANLSAVPTEFGPDNAIPGAVTVTGIWLGDAICVRDQSPEGPERETHPDCSAPPCAPPPEGWPEGMNGQQDRNLEFDLGDLMTSGTAVTAVTFRPSTAQAVLVIAATDRDTVISAMGPQLPGRLCIVDSRWTRAELDRVRSQVLKQWSEWAIDMVSGEIDDAAQPSIALQLLRVTTDVAAWADTLPPGILKLRPSLTPG